jgi:HPt (histidine-containing phosphotransfer) domain-containing protein
MTMTLQELYSSIGEDYEQALRVLRVEKLVDKHIRKLTKNGVIEALLAAGEGMDAAQLFETAHAAKGNCGNLGLTKLYAATSEIAEEYRPGNPRKMTDEEVKSKLQEISALYAKTADAINRYEAENP